MSYTNSVIDWEHVPITRQSGDSGFVWFRTFEAGNIRIRLAEYSRDFRSDQWSRRRHFIHLLEGEMCFEFMDGSVIRLADGMSYCLYSRHQVSHKSFTEKGAFLLIVD